jgi:hypothetical protein
MSKTILFIYREEAQEMAIAVGTRRQPLTVSEYIVDRQTERQKYDDDDDDGQSPLER